MGSDSSRTACLISTINTRTLSLCQAVITSKNQVASIAFSFVGKTSPESIRREFLRDRRAIFCESPSKFTGCSAVLISKETDAARCFAQALNSQDLWLPVHKQTTVTGFSAELLRQASTQSICSVRVKRSAEALEE